MVSHLLSSDVISAKVRWRLVFEPDPWWFPGPFLFIAPHQMTTAPTISLPTKWPGCTVILTWSTRSGWRTGNLPPSLWPPLWQSRVRILSQSTGCHLQGDRFIRSTTMWALNLNYLLVVCTGFLIWKMILSQSWLYVQGLNNYCVQIRLQFLKTHWSPKEKLLRLTQCII